MKLRNIFAGIAAAAVAVSAMAVNVFAADEYTAKLGFADMSWAAQDWDTSVTVTGDGQYTLESTTVAGAADFGVFVVDIEGMYAGAPDATAVLDSIEVDGAALSFDASKIVYGDIEEKGNFRIEIYNQYGSTLDNSPVDNSTAISSSLKITFTVSGLSGGAAEAAPAADSGATTSAKTGNAAVASIAAVMAVAGAAAVASRKRK
ncbi:MAG: hypothetical protein J1F11_01785 [Oscillospiraceae bacterium]|nr:hypothetical protein [Oscillospiraceae bacterium]